MLQESNIASLAPFRYPGRRMDFNASSYSVFEIRPQDPSEQFSLPSGVLNLWLDRFLSTPSYAAKQAAL